MRASYYFSCERTALCPLGLLLQMMKPSSNPPPIVAVDAPSGWHVENGDESGQPWHTTAYVTDHAPVPMRMACSSSKADSFT